MTKRNLKVIKGGKKEPGTGVWRRWLFALLIIGFCCYLVFQSMGWVLGRVFPLELVGRATEVWGPEVDFVLLRNEEILASSHTGSYIAVVEHGQRARVGQQVAEIHDDGARYSLATSVAGLVMHKTDGWEGMLPTSLSLDAETVVMLGELVENPPEANTREYVQSGEVVAVIVSNTRFALTSFFDYQPFSITQTARFLHRENSYEVSLRVNEVFEWENGYWVKWEAPLFPDALADNRILSGRLKFPADGVCVVSPEAVIEYQGESGVLLYSRGSYNFTPVSVMAVTEEYAYVQGLRPGQQLLAVPVWAHFVTGWWFNR